MATDQAAFPAQPILIVGEDDWSVFALEVALRSEGITNLWTVSDSKTLPRMLASEAFSLVLLDRNVAGRSGSEVLRRAEELEGRPPFIVIGGSPPPHVWAQGPPDEMVEYLVKPVDQDRLIRVVRTALARPHRAS